MEETLEKVAEHLYRRQYQTAKGEWKTIYYGIFTDWKGKRRKVALGSDLKAAKDGLSIWLADNVKRVDFDGEKQKARQQGMTVSTWAKCYLELEQVKKKRSLRRDRDLIAAINRHVGEILLTGIKREHLFRFRNERLQEHIVRAGKPRAKTISAGTVANELSCLRTMLNRARECEIEAATPSFKGLIQRSQRDRILDADEETALLETYPEWLRRIAIVARETCLSQGDIIRLTKAMIDRQRREIVPAGGRVKTGVEQRAPLTDRVLELLDEIEREKRRGKIVANVNGLIFTRDDGRAIKKDMITQAVRLARKRAEVADFHFHDYRHSAKTEWSRQGVHVDVAMKAAGHKSVAMHQRYVNLKPGDVAKAFGIVENCSQVVPKDSPANRAHSANS
jgi:integrase